MVKCPKCNHEQEEGSECLRCGIIFEKYKSRPQERVDRREPRTPSGSGIDNSVLRRIFFFVGFAMVCLFICLAVVLFKKDALTNPAKKAADAAAGPAKPVAAMPAQKEPQGVAKDVAAAYPPQNKIEEARNATVFIENMAQSGSGFFIDADCSIVTCRHVVEMTGEQIEQMKTEFEQAQKLIEAAESKITYYENNLASVSDAEVRENIAAMLKQKREEIDALKAQQNKMQEHMDELQAKGTKVSLINDKEYSATIVAISDKADLALIKINADNCPSLSADTSLDLPIGKKVYTIGNPKGMNYTVTSGVVSTKRIDRDTGALFIQTDAPINSGNSGGPLIDEHGKVIGVNSFILRDSAGIGFAIPIATVYEEFGRYLRKHP